MKKPFNGRANVIYTMRGFTIEIPVKRHFFVIVFLAAWLGGWAIGEYFALTQILGLGDSNLEGFALGFIIFWLIGWTIGGFFAIRTWLWMLTGKEVITFDSSELVIRNNGALFSKPKVYDIKQVKNITVEPIILKMNSDGKSSAKSFFKIGNSGIFKFDYGSQTVRFGDCLDEAEGKKLLQLILDSKLLKQ